MSAEHMALTLFFIILFIAALAAEVFSRRVNNALFDWGARLMKKIGLDAEVEWQRTWSLWATRAFVILVMAYSAMMLYFLLKDVNW